MSVSDDDFVLTPLPELMQWFEKTTGCQVGAFDVELEHRCIWMVYEVGHGASRETKEIQHRMIWTAPEALNVDWGDLNAFEIRVRMTADDLKQKFSRR